MFDNIKVIKKYICQLYTSMNYYLDHSYRNMMGGGNCTLCGSPNTNKTTCPLNRDAAHPNPAKHPLAAAKMGKIVTEPVKVPESVPEPPQPPQQQPVFGPLPEPVFGPLAEPVFGPLAEPQSQPQVEPQQPQPKPLLKINILAPKTNSKEAEILNKINNVEDMRGTFNNLLYTHNTLIPTFMLMITGQYSFIRCCQQTWSGVEIPAGRGAQFRYGLDSQYGEVKIILKPKFWEQYSRGVSLETGDFVDYPNFYDFWTQKGYEGDSNDLKYLLETQALNYNFRVVDEKLGLTNEGGEECKQYTRNIMENKEKGLPPSVLDTAYPSWCNVQLHLGNNVKYDDILAVIVPSFLKDPDIIFSNIQTAKMLESAQNDDTLPDGKPNPFKGKLIFVQSGTIVPAKYYGYRSENVGNKSGNALERDFYNNLRKKLGQTTDDNRFMQRNRFPNGNSSLVATSSDEFKKEQQEYMRLLVQVGFYN